MSSKINNHLEDSLDIVDETVGKRQRDKNSSDLLFPGLYGPGSVSRALPPVLWDTFALWFEGHEFGTTKSFICWEPHSASFCASLTSESGGW